MPNRFRALAFLPLLVPAPLLASETTFGFQGQVAIPTGTFGDAGHLDRKVGLGLGLQMPIDFGGGHILRPKLDYLSLSRDSSGINYKAEALVLLADYNYHFAGSREGAYLIAGLGLHSTRRNVTRTFGPLSAKADSTDTGFAYNLGLGYAFNPNVALEAKYLGLNLGTLGYGVLGTDAGFMGNSVVVSVGLTF